MIDDFDKEIDSLLRESARKAGHASAATNAEWHFDADVISAFAEGALPAQARASAMKHLADCDRCRKILSEVVTLNSESQSETIHLKESAAVVVQKTIPWHKKVFALPNLVYALGACVVLFGGMIAFIAVQNANRNGDLAKVTSVKGVGETSPPSISENESRSAANVFADAANASSNISSSSNSASAVANLSSPQESAGASNLRESSDAYRIGRAGPMQKETSSKSDAMVGVKENEVGKLDAKSELPATPTAVSPPAPVEKAREEDKKFQVDSVDATVDVSVAKQNDPQVQVQNQTQNQTGAMMPDTQNSRRNLPARQVEYGASRQKSQGSPNAAGSVAALEEGKARTEQNVTSRTVGGKTFNAINGVWTDSTYAGQKTKRVKRTSNDYKKLDANLRATADNLGGAVIIVWNSKAYRIQ